MQNIPPEKKVQLGSQVAQLGMTLTLLGVLLCVGLCLFIAIS